MSEEENNSVNLPRFTISLEHFEKTIINLMAEKMGKSKSEILRNIINDWIITNQNILESKYGIILDDVLRENQLWNIVRKIKLPLN